MDHELICVVCKKVFYGHKNKKHCSQDCKNIDRRNKRREANKGKRRKDANKRYYLKNKYILTKKYETEQINKEEREREYSRLWNINNKIKKAEYRRRSIERKRRWFDEYKKTLKCEICGYDKCPGSLDFHHEGTEEKEFNIGHSFNFEGKEKIISEIKKCVVLCANCHRELHYKEQQEKVKKIREEYLDIINKPKKMYYNILEKELNTDWFKDLQNKAKYNLIRFSGNQYVRTGDLVKEKIDIKNILAKKIGLGTRSTSRLIQIYKRGTEEQKERARIGKESINKIYKELKPIRYSTKVYKK